MIAIFCEEIMKNRTKYYLVGSVITVCVIFVIIDTVPLSQGKAIALARATLQRTMTDDEIEGYEVNVTRKGIAWVVLYRSKEYPYLGNHFMVYVYSKYKVRIVPGE